MEKDGQTSFAKPAHLLAVFSYYMTSGEIFKSMHKTMIGKKVSQLENHFIVCGYGRYGQEVCDHFIHQKTPFVVIEKDQNVIELIQQVDKKILYVHDDATKDEVLMEAGISKASALLATLHDDSENLFIVLGNKEQLDSLRKYLKSI